MATLKIRDLSVGDWVMVEWPDGERWRGRLTQLSESGGIEVSCANGKHVRCSSNFISPIPITAEILEKNGFTRRSVELTIYEYTTLLGKMLRTTVVGLNHPYSYIACRVEDTSKELHALDRIPVSSSVDRNPIHIHELQRVLRLAGIDKEINL